jgi:hypothetical protein
VKKFHPKLNKNFASLDMELPNVFPLIAGAISIIAHQPTFPGYS